MSGTKREPEQGPAVWHARDLAQDGGWNLRFDAGEQAELRRAAEAERAPQMPGVAARCVEIRRELEHGRGIMRIAGFELDGLDEPRITESFLAFAERLGTPVSQTIDGDRIFRVADAGLRQRDAAARGPNSRRALTFHSDRCDVIGFLCVRQAARGGHSIVVSAGAIHNEIARTRPDLLEVLYEPFYWERHNIDRANENACYRMPVFARTSGQLAVTLMQVLIDRAHRRTDLPDLSAPQAEALALVQRLAATPEFQVRFRQVPGEILLLNNYVTLHSRTAFEDPPRADGRLLLRVWLAVPDSRPLDPSWVAHYGGVEPGAVRGGIRRLGGG